MKSASLFVLAAVATAAFPSCSSSPAAPRDAGTVSVADGGGDGSAAPRVAGLELFTKLAGLWSGPATDTRLGEFPLKNMDLRPVGDSTLFGRVDLDADNSLRFLFAVEVHDGAPVIVFRNGGLFQGLSRDTRTKLVEALGDSYRFCAIDGGCDYVDAEFRFSSTTAFDLRVMVRRVLHERWNPTRVEPRELPPGFPARLDLPANGDFPPMPSADLRVRFASALAAPSDVWVILSTTSCIPSGDCRFSRWIKARPAAGATDVTIRLDQLHAGSYSLLAVVDSNSNLATTRFPDSGDFISVPSPTIVVAPSGRTAAEATAGFRFP